MANDRITINGVEREIDSEWITINGVWRKVDKTFETVNGVHREAYTSYDPNIPGTWTFSISARNEDRGKSTPYYTLFTRAQANEAIANGYSRVEFNLSAMLYNTAGEYPNNQRFTVAMGGSAPSQYSWDLDVAYETGGSHNYETISATCSWPLSRMSGSPYATAFGFKAGVFANYYTYRVYNGQVTNVRFA